MPQPALPEVSGPGASALAWAARARSASRALFHVVFTLPHALNPLCQRHPRLLYDLLFRATAETMLEVAADPKHLGARIGFLSILHTWGQNLRLHPHLHCVIPAGGFDPGYSRWVHPRYAFFLPVKVLSRVFRGVSAEGEMFALRRSQR